LPRRAEARTAEAAALKREKNAAVVDLTRASSSLPPPPTVDGAGGSTDAARGPVDAALTYSLTVFTKTAEQNKAVGASYTVRGSTLGGSEEGFVEPIVDAAQIVSLLRCHHSGHKNGQLADPVSSGPPALFKVGHAAAGVPKLDLLSRVRSPVDLTVADYKALPNTGLDHRTLTLCVDVASPPTKAETRRQSYGSQGVPTLVPSVWQPRRQGGTPHPFAAVVTPTPSLTLLQQVQVYTELLRVWTGSYLPNEAGFASTLAYLSANYDRATLFMRLPAQLFCLPELKPRLDSAQQPVPKGIVATRALATPPKTSTAGGGGSASVSPTSSPPPANQWAKKMAELLSDTDAVTDMVNKNYLNKKEGAAAIVELKTRLDFSV